MKIISENFGENVQFKFHTNKFVLHGFTVPVWLLYCVIEIVVNWLSKVKILSYPRSMAHPLRTSIKLK